jgi:hypothetical protein
VAAALKIIQDFLISEEIQALAVAAVGGKGKLQKSYLNFKDLVQCLVNQRKNYQ